MSYILTCEKCRCRHIKFIEQNGELLTKGVGKTYTGTIALQIFNDRDDMRITLADAKNVYSGLLKKTFLPLNSDYLCHFDVNDAERKNNKKLLKIQAQSDSGLNYYMLICFDFSTHTGASYLFPNFDEVKKWANKLGISTYEILDSAGKLVSVKNI